MATLSSIMSTVLSRGQLASQHDGSISIRCITKHLVLGVSLAKHLVLPDLPCCSLRSVIDAGVGLDHIQDMIQSLFIYGFKCKCRVTIYSCLTDGGLAAVPMQGAQLSNLYAAQHVHHILAISSNA